MIHRDSKDQKIKIMKKSVFMLFSLLMIGCTSLYGKDTATKMSSAAEDTLRILSSPDLYNLSVRWANEFNNTHPGTKIKISSISDRKIINDLVTGGNIAFVSNEYFSVTPDDSFWKLVVGRDIIVPVINSSNPFLQEINQHGVSPEKLKLCIENPDSKSWGTMLTNKEKASVKYYRTNDLSVTKAIAEFLGKGEAPLSGIEVANGTELISAIQKDPYAIGFCKMITLLDQKNQNLIENISLLPIDRNNNGIIDYNEKIYSDLSAFSRGVWIGKYPKALFSNIYTIASDQPKTESEMIFLKWIVTDGQQFLFTSGYSDLLISERQTTVDKLYNARNYSTPVKSDNTLPRTAIIILASLILTVIIIDLVIRYFRRRKTTGVIIDYVADPVFSESTVRAPNGIYFDKTHTWAFMEQNGTVKVGIDDFLQHIAGPVTRIKMKNPGEIVKKGEQIMSIVQNGKQLNLYSPVSGVIKEQNKVLETNSSVINSSPYNNGWIYVIEPSNWNRENQLLFMAEKYRQFIREEFTRLKDFLAVALQADSQMYSRVILQDGGELRNGVLSDLGPEVWEDFQTKFIDPSRQIWFYEIF
jgi:glycine cleavage system H lipoate-binding protein/ABC-type phosphate transport system substrate-binding protein